MTTRVALAYLLILSYFVVERLLRQGQPALSLQPGQSDQSSSKMLWISGLFNLLLVLIAPLLNTVSLGHWQNLWGSWLGLGLMVSGLCLRYWAAKTLGKFYTRTLQTFEGQDIIEQAPYNLIRHPGYLGTFLWIIGAGLAVENWIVTVTVTAVGLLSRIYRIRSEEAMLLAELSEQYQAYSQKTWRLVPLIY
ncbi:isoprenylcysteine carboxylmethyltransferase family protein [Acaryochloris sp. IP29b_bin.148]|uniref:methyltransferase family protein n=1 Tax=Acaryochloris sp. IP29b_bin.148 TaxID=2969218 RepID=UPI002601F84E|nr:isoprenylcysteine carboxylmethyltransferase family protein [Acaryochloris sp. IP29b_bin.148]